MVRIDYKTLFWWFVKILIFLVLVIVIWFLGGFIKPFFLKYVDDSIRNEFSLLRTGVSILYGFLDVYIAAFITSHVESIFVAKQDFPRIFITPPNGNAKNISGIKMTHSFDQHLCVGVGECQPKFRIIYAKIKNTGQSIISECIINNKKLSIILDPDEQSELYFIVYESGNSERTISNYKLPYYLRDDQGNVYFGKYCMKVNTNDSIATFHVLKKIKRRILKNALSNL